MKPLKILGWMSLLFGLVLLVALFSGNVGAWSTTTFNNSLGSENITLAGDNVPSWTSSTGNRTYPFTYSYDYNYNTYTEINHGAIVYYNFSGQPNDLTMKLLLSGDGSDALDCYNGSSWYSISLASFSSVNPAEATLNLPINCQSGNLTLRFTGGSLEFQYMRIYEVYQGLRSKRYLSIPSTVSALTNAKMNLSGYEPNPGLTSCYQETADVANGCGGLSTGTYALEEDRSYSYYYINYSKPVGVTSAKWMVRHGDSTKVAYNVTIPRSCFDYQSNKVSLRMYSFGNAGSVGTSYGQCLGNSGWETITNTYTGWPTTGWCHSQPPTYINDGNWNTLDHFYVVFPGTPSQAFYWGYSGCSADTSGANLYEEAVIWNYEVLYNNSVSVINLPQIWNYSGTFNQTNNRTTNFATYINNYLSTCSYVSGYCNVPFLFHSDTAGILGYSDMSYDNTGITENGQTYNPTTYEYAIEPFTLNLSYDSGYWNYIVGTLVYDGTAHTSTRTGTLTNALFSTSISIPALSGSVNKSFYWSVALTNSTSTIYYNTTEHNQTVANISLSICGSAPYNVVYENFTFKDEATGDDLNASTDLSTWGYAIGTSTIYKSYIFINSTLNPSYAFCFYPSDKSIAHTVAYQYSSTGYPQRHYYQSGTLTNSSTNRILYLLASTPGSGIYSSFQVINQAGAPISGVIVQASRQIGGVSTLVEQGTTDSSGLVTFWLNPNYDHSLTVTKSGYATQTLTIRPTQSIYTIVMGGGSVSNGTYSEPIQGVKYTKTPASGILAPGAYDFTFNITASKANMISCKLELVNSTGSIVDSGITACIDHGYISLVHAFVEGDNIYGRYYVDTGSGYIKLEGDANWKFIPINQSHYSIKDLLKYLSEPDVLTTSETERRQFEFTKLVCFFLIFAIVAGFMNKESNFDSANPGIFLFLMPLVVALMSLSGGLTGNGFFYIEGATGFHFLDNYLLAFLTFLVALGMYLATIRREG